MNNIFLQTKTKKTMTRKDKLTGELFEAKRVSQYFANSKNRIKWHNIVANNLRHNTAYINKPLHANVRLLNELMIDKNELIAHKQFLLGKGFSFGVHTHYEEYKGITQSAIYQYIIIPAENEQVKIVRR